MKKLLQKILDEVQKDKPDLSYIRGMIETMMDMDEPSQGTLTFTNGNYVPPIGHVAPVSVAEQAAQMAEAGFVKGVVPMETETNIVLN